MKKINHIKNNHQKNTILCIVCAFIVLLSCKDQDVMFKEYVVEGGISYLGSVSGLTSRIGFNRLEVNFNVVDMKTTKVGIYWNDYQDSVMVNIGKQKVIHQIIELPEGEYSLFVKSFDEKGNSSNAAELITRTVGNDYLVSLAHRGIKSKSTTFKDDLSIEWLNPDPVNGARFTNLIYTATDGKLKRLRVDNGTTFTSINDYKQGTTFKRVTYYSPDNKWLDSIVPPAVDEVSLMIDKKLGGIIEYSSQSGNNVASNFYNGNFGDTWLTNNNYPQYITVDLGREIPVSGFGIWPSYQMTGGKADPRAPTSIKFESSLDNIDWRPLANFDYDNSLYYNMRLFNVPITLARFVRFSGVECLSAPIYSESIGGEGTKEMSLAELDVFFQILN
ncbi:MAG TPA: hypothetical protein DDZ96_10180 [Porphyromonadaceae bacterium]|jgi:hypothetical protein|uniref:DUF4998 domain-containing protein n=1 Tax=Limibacterium fermenti TaxID=3229863 RepID=UPI000E9E045B|nr:hypothetical protein [Porphyromonadaceae bacterium]HBK30645.1 hypothetical protein [Porphyromonadaceae bacterium]HBL34165.1 hypothetical protein [Porphyromonadaceae bacterium]HBX46200.1 hypothetical protein [Porphyromonadaceae bacterium]HCM19864.1 hypothetical protein [Porphyromonadaceae bacterium]